jgi:hypothetical protein
MFDPILSPEQASARLAELGIRRAKTTLAKLRCLGGGPEFVKIGKRDVGYYQSGLDRYATEIISEPRRSTSGVAA